MIKLSDVKLSDLQSEDSFTLSPLISNLKNVATFTDWKTVERGLNILKVFRNKEGHVAVICHKYNSQNYRDIKAAIKLFYYDAFNEQIEFQIFMEKNDIGKFSIKC